MPALISSRSWGSRREYPRPTQVAPAASISSTGLSGYSGVPRGVDRPGKPSGEVGVYCPVVRP